jgi:mitochondrial GTPase 1
MAGIASRYAGAVNWFPGHMAKASAELAARVRDCDVVIEVRDARVPFSSANPLLDSLTAARPRVVVFNKADLANAALQARVAGAVRADATARGGPCHECLFTDASRGVNVGRLLATVDAVQRAAVAGTRAGRFNTTGSVMLVVGLPNTGKSTLINALRGAAGTRAPVRGARTGAEPGVTRSVSLLRVRAQPPLYLADSPGVMLPRVADVETGLKLLVTGAIKESAAPALAQAEWLHAFLVAVGSTRYAAALGLPRLYAADESGDLLRDLAARLGAVKPGGERAPDVDAAARHLVRAYQTGSLGRYTLDHVPQLVVADAATAPVEGGSQSVSSSAAAPQHKEPRRRGGAAAGVGAGAGGSGPGRPGAGT